MLKIFVLIDIWQVIQKWLKTKIWSFLWRIWRWKEKGQIFLTFWCGDLNPRFSVIFPPMIGIFMWSVEPKIKSKQASKRDRTLREHFQNANSVNEMNLLMFCLGPFCWYLNFYICHYISINKTSSKKFNCKTFIVRWIITKMLWLFFFENQVFEVQKSLL